MSKQIDKLTKAQEAKIPEYIEKYMKIGLDTSPIDKPAAEAAVRALYKYMKYSPIKQFHWVEDPFTGCELAAKFAMHPQAYQPEVLATLRPTQEQIADQAANKASYGSFEAYWVAFYDFVQSELPVDPHELVNICKDIVKSCGIFWTFEEHVIMSPKPAAIRLKDEKLHSENDLPALEYANGAGVFAENGKVYPTLMAMKMAKKLEK